MLFNSLEFLAFFPAVVLAYSLCPRRHAWVVLLAASYFFYMWWRAPYVILILASTVVDFFVARQLGKTEERGRRRALLLVSLSLNLGLLAFFKYSAFIASSLMDLLAGLDVHVEIPSSGVQIPVGISFYTLQTLSYTIEVFRKRAKHERHIGIFALYVAFFPQLVAGPIERPQHLLPQLRNRAAFEWKRVASGVRLMLWGGFQKVVVADQLAAGVDYVYKTPDGISGPLVLVATYLFAIQIYCDFAGYSNIAIGAARVLGVDLMDNFARPYFAQSIRDFWRRWHISLSTWFRDYLYVPLGGNRRGLTRTCINLMLVFLVSGLWHGANWTYVAWGGAHGLFLVIGILVGRQLPRPVQLAFVPSVLKKILAILFVFHLVCFTWVLFRATSIEHAMRLFDSVLSWKNAGASLAIPTIAWPLAILGVSVLFVVDVASEWGKQRDCDVMQLMPPVFRYASVWLLILWITLYGVFDKQEFIYFKF